MRLWPFPIGFSAELEEEWIRPHFQAVSEVLNHGIFRTNVLYWASFEELINEAFGRIVMRGKGAERVLYPLHDWVEAIKMRP